MYSLNEIVKRYNDSVSEYSAYIVALNEHNEDVQAQHLRNAGEGLSQVLEQALKLHVQTHDPVNLSRYERVPTPKIISVFYYDDSNVTQMLYNCTIEVGIKPTVDFDYLKRHKNELTNASKHNGGTVVPSVIEEYMKQCKSFILEYLDKKAILRDTVYFMDAQQDNIQRFYVACDQFQREDRTYILLTEEQDQIDQRCYRHFSLAPWDIIIDFHNKSSENGFIAGAYNKGANIAHIYKTSDIINSDDVFWNMQKPFCFFANGFKSERSYSEYKEWNRYYYNKLDKFLDVISRNITTQKTIVVSLLNNEEYIENLRTMIDRYFTNIVFVIANDTDDKFLDLYNRKKYYYEHVTTSIEEIDTCFENYLLKIGEATTRTNTYSLPFIVGEGKGLLNKDELLELEECFEVLYLGIGEGTDDNIESFLRGEKALTWQGAKRGFAAKRDHFQRMYVNPLLKTIQSGRSKIYIIHEAGFGGSTVARQLAYSLHESYPVLYLKEFRNKAVIRKLDWLHDRTKKTIVVFMEIPSVIAMDDFEYLFQSTNQTRPYVFVGVMRGHPSAKTIGVTDWGNDTILLSDKYVPIIKERYTGNEKKDKLQEVQNIINGNDDVYKRTPFYFGMLTYEKDFVAANGFYEKFVQAVNNNEIQRKILIYLSLCDVYANKPLPESFFKTVVGVDKKAIFKLEQCFDEEDSIFYSLIQPETVGNVRYMKPKYTYFSKQFLSKLLRKENTPVDTGWKENLGIYCKDFIVAVAQSSVASKLEEDVLQPLFIGSSKERDGEKFTDVFDDILDEERINIFLTLHEQFPENPHFCSHLARYYAIKEKNREKALDFAERAIRLSVSPDPLLHHMKGMCYYYIIKDKTEADTKMIRRGQYPSQEDLDEITGNLLVQAEAEFQKSREIQQKSHHEDEYGFIPNIKLLLKVFDFYILANQESRKNVIALAKEPYILWLDKAQSLLDNARRLQEDGAESELFIDCESSLWAEYEDYSNLIEKLNNQLVRSPHPSIVRRQLAQIYMKRDDEYKTSARANRRILTLMDDNMKTDAKNIHNFILWFKAARYSSLNIDEILTRLAQWNAVNPAIDLLFYSYVFNAIKAIEGSSEAYILAKKYIQECRSMGGGNRISIKEWYGDAPQEIIANFELRDSSKEFTLYEVTGYVKEYQHPGNAVIELDCGLEVFFKPSLNSMTDSCLNHNVKFHLGFSYDGLRAENGSVKLLN